MNAEQYSSHAVNSTAQIWPVLWLYSHLHVNTEQYSSYMPGSELYNSDMASSTFVKSFYGGQYSFHIPHCKMKCSSVCVLTRILYCAQFSVIAVIHGKHGSHLSIVIKIF